MSIVRDKKRYAAVLGLLAALWLSGCGTTTQRFGTEQLLLSDAVDLAVEQLDFHSLAWQKVYLDTTYLQTVKDHGFVNAPYIISCLRQQLTAAGCQLQDNRGEADVIIEPRVGALGSNGHEISYGMPRNNLLTSAASILPGSPNIPAIPEISLARIDAQSGIAKLMVFAYDRETREPIWQSGVARAESTSRSTWVLGAGPFQRGSVYNGPRFAGTSLKRNSNFALQEKASGVDYVNPFEFPQLDPEPRVAELEIGDSESENRSEEEPGEAETENR